MSAFRGNAWVGVVGTLVVFSVVACGGPKAVAPPLPRPHRAQLAFRLGLSSCDSTMSTHVTC